MSWSFIDTGFSSPLAVKARKDLTAFTCAEPEEKAKLAALDIIETLCNSLPNAGFKIEAAGSMGYGYTNGKPLNHYFNLNIQTLPLVMEEM